MDLPLIKFVHEKFLKIRYVTNQKIQVLVRWKNVDEYFDTWEPAETLRNFWKVSKNIDTLKTLPVVDYPSANFSDEMSEGVYVIEKILFAMQYASGKIYVYIKWENYSIDDSTWEPIDNIDNFLTILPDLRKCFEKTSQYISKVSLTVPSTFQSIPSQDSFSHCDSNVIKHPPMAQTPLSNNSSFARKEPSANSVSFSYPSTTRNSTTPNPSYRDALTRQSLSDPCSAFSNNHQTSDCSHPLLKSQLYTKSQLETNSNQNILGFPKTFLEHLDHATSSKLIQTYEKLSKIMPLTVSGEYDQLVKNFKTMITTVCQTASTQNRNNSTSFSTTQPITSFYSGKDNDVAIHTDKNKINDCMQHFNAHKKTVATLSDRTLFNSNLDTVDLKNKVQERLSKGKGERNLNIKNVTHALLKLVSTQNFVFCQSDQDPSALSKNSELNFRNLFLEMKKNLLIQYRAQENMSQLFFQSIKDSRDMGFWKFVDRNSLFQNTFNKEYKQILDQSRKNENQDLAIFYDSLKKAAQYFRPTSTPDFLSHHWTNSEIATDQTSFLDKHSNRLSATEKHKHNFRGQNMLHEDFEKSRTRDVANTKIHLDDNGNKKLQKKSLHKEDSSQGTRTMYWNKEESKKRFGAFTKKNNVTLHGSLPKIASNPYSTRSRSINSTLAKCNGKPHNVSKMSQNVTKSVEANQSTTADNLLPFNETKSRQDFPRHDIKNLSAPHEIRSIQRRTRQVYKNAAQQSRQTSQQTLHGAAQKNDHRLHLLVTTYVEEPFSQLSISSVADCAELCTEASPLHQVNGSQSATHKILQNSEFSDCVEKKLVERSRSKAGPTKNKKSSVAPDQNLFQNATEIRSTTKQHVKSSVTKLKSNATSPQEDSKCSATDTQKVTRQIHTPWGICIPASDCLLQLQSESKKSLSTLSLKYLPSESNQVLRCFCSYSERLSKALEQNIVKWLSRQSPTTIQNGILCTVCSSQDHFLCSLNWKSLTTKKTVDTKIKFLIQNFICIPCRLQLLDPFFCVRNICGLSVTQSPEDVVFSETLIIKKTPIDFHLTNSCLKQLEDGKLQLQFRGMELSPDTYRVSSFPPQLSLYISGALTKPPLLTLKPPGPLKKRKEVPHTLDAKDVLENKIKRFIIECGFQQHKTFLFCLVLVSPITSEKLLNLTLKNNWLSLSFCRDLTNAVISHTIKKVNNNDDVVMERQDVNVVSLRCPSTLMRINLPGRGIFCRHLQCFDIHFYIESQSRIGSHKNRWKCPVCYGFCYVHEIILDSFFNDILNQTNEFDRMVIIKSTNNELSWRVTERDQAFNLNDSANSTPGVDVQSSVNPGALPCISSECLDDRSPIEQPTLVIDID